MQSTAFPRLLHKSLLEEGGMQAVKRIIGRRWEKQFIIRVVKEQHRVAESAAKSQWWKRSNKWKDKGDTISKCPVTPIHLGYRLLNNSSSIKSAQFNISLAHALTVALRQVQWNQEKRVWERAHKMDTQASGCVQSFDLWHRIKICAKASLHACRVSLESVCWRGIRQQKTRPILLPPAWGGSECFPRMLVWFKLITVRLFWSWFYSYIRRPRCHWEAVLDWMSGLGTGQ